MAYDGLFIKAQINEIKKQILGEHITKINESSNKEVDIIVRKNGENLSLTLSANPNFPHILLSDNKPEKFMNPPAFCMLLRKYLESGIIKNIRQIGGKTSNSFNNDDYLERIVEIEIENVNDLGEKTIYHLFIEIMGKYSNIIITDKDLIILDVLLKSGDNKRLIIKENYDINEVCQKIEILDTCFNEFESTINEEVSLSKINKEQFDIKNAITKRYAGLSKSLISHIVDNLNINDIKKIYDEIIKTVIKYKDRDTQISTCVINYKTDKPSDFYLFKLDNFLGEIKTFSSINSCLKTYINEKFSEIKESTEKKTVEAIINNLFIKLNKKLDIYKSDIVKSENYEKYKLWAELISAYGYNNKPDDKGNITCENFNDNNKLVLIPIDTTLSIPDNIEKYYNRYNKLKRTIEQASNLIKETNEKLEHLDSIKESLNLSSDKEDIFLIKEELIKYFDESNKISSLKNQKQNINKRNNNKYSKSSKLNYHISHYKSTSGIDIYVGKNNLQNEYLTFTMADSDDTWFHIKNATGSHVILKKSYEEIDDKTLIEAASLAAYFSSRKNETKATVDYTLRKELKKVKGKAPGFCIYHKNYSINVKPEIIVKEVP